MTVPAPGARPADADGAGDPGAEADRCQTWHDALVDLLAAAEPDDTAGAAAGGPAPGSVPRGPG